VVSPYPVPGRSTVDVSLDMFAASGGNVAGPYGLGAGHHLAGVFPPQATVHGPNGFLREFRGAGVDVTVRRGWYDVKITSDADHTYLRRLAGHVETGDPAA
jgi:hypothetical protein